jgi:hypothetical protein
MRSAWADDSDLTTGGTLVRLELRVMPPGEPPFETTIRLEYAEWLAVMRAGEGAAALRDEALPVFTRLGANPWLERAQALGFEVPA